MLHVMQHLLRTLINRRTALEQFGVEQDRPEPIVDIVRDARSQHSHCLDFLSLPHGLINSFTRHDGAACLREAAQHCEIVSRQSTRSIAARFIGKHAPQRAFCKHRYEQRLMRASFDRHQHRSIIR